MVYAATLLAALALNGGTVSAAAPLHLAQAESTFPGSLFCEASGSMPALRAPVTVAITGRTASYTVQAPGGAERGTGQLDSARGITLAGGSTGASGYGARYAGEVGGRGGLLTGTHTSKAGSKSVTRRCQMTLGDGRG
jgi:hypothetical protein